MAFERLNLQKKLEKVRNKQISEAQILEQVKKILQERTTSEEEILQEIRDGNESGSNDFDLDLLDSQRIFHISHIEKICIDYRLRFLETKYFKSEFPQEAIDEIKNLQEEHSTVLKGFKIMAPAKLFKLKNADDPILFAPIGNEYFYLVKKWGNDLNRFRKIKMWPVKTIENLLIFCLSFSFLFTFAIRAVFFARYQSNSEFIMLYFFTFNAVAGLIVFYGISLGKNFSSSIWRSKYYNA